ncbi:DotU family type IV/VI secretion system protein [Geobacter sulfurreducens]|uniref:Type VI secretion system inner membrane protein TssL n=3 Tax=Geobacter sulfurreducens TaxID=35554 RepID=Q747V0_GEOSL|nr:type VI secretion system inner membrane protein TssL [Geobacter sulfurreducens PCA]ADI85916.1 type VI secretion system inner membrane protein TssL [Geobacter sulfurreducens KN400]AJY71878.1 type VI secretion system protein ImpK [Geobacter sulfurreducens]QVW36981.1 DotU family type IV/VI secretion system protein [Geobacter sulfurreducens]UAC05870.1 DotU family type IV/VI secretion system protein [Geobacter sulfurreducens]
MHLTDCFTDVMAYLNHSLRTIGVRQPPYGEIRCEIERFMATADAAARSEGLDGEEFDLARFAVCAWIDEAILSSSWEEKNTWLKEQLQRIHYATTDAGEEFFTRLTALGLNQREVREVFYLCLAFGFTGKYCKPGDEYHLEQLKTAQLKLLMGSSVGLPSLERTELFPEAWPSGPAPATVRPGRGQGSRAFLVAVAAVPVALFLILLLAYRFTLTGVGDTFLRTVPY